MKVRTLCYDCAKKFDARFMKAWEHNQDKDVDWWERWWGPHNEKQMNAIKTHCWDLPAAYDDPRNKKP